MTLMSTGDKPIERSCGHSSKSYAIVDLEVGSTDHKIHDIGALKHDGAVFHGASTANLMEFLDDVDYLCGHNIVHHDACYLHIDAGSNWKLVDTLYMSPLLFPEHPYHNLVKDDKLIVDQLNNPVNDCVKARDLLMDEINEWNRLPEAKRLIMATLLKDKKEFSGFLSMIDADYLDKGLMDAISRHYAGKICDHAPLEALIDNNPEALAYALALTDTTDHSSITPPWVLNQYPEVENIIKTLRHTLCHRKCDYCDTKLDVFHNLKRFFGFNEFRIYDGEPLQERAARAAVEGKSLLAIFPTGGGKSLTFQLPALMAGESTHGLTVIISPLQSLMKDQVDNLYAKDITNAVTLNGMQDAIERSSYLNRVNDGSASLLYISPEMLRSNTIERILMNRHVVRFVIDEAHCFSSWGHDFRVDYLYIGTFIKNYQKKKQCGPIPVSCFTATAKQKVIQDIRDYFMRTLGLDLELYASSASRTNLRYSVIHVENNEEKYSRLRNLISASDCPTIVYVSRTKRTIELAQSLTRDGYPALPFNGKMDPELKKINQEAFMNDQTRIIVATSAFGMGVDKSDVGMVIHYDISDSLENYAQEAGRAGRDPKRTAKCYVLYNDDDLDKHFIMLNQTKLSINEIQQVWKVIKNMTKNRETVNCSALEIARQAGWDDSVTDIETRVRTAISALEQSNFLKRGNNMPHVYATGITVTNMDEARQRISESRLFDNDEVEKAVRIIKSLITQKNTVKARGAEAESRVDYLADLLGMTKRDVITLVERMRQEGILADSRDISAYLHESGFSANKSLGLLERLAKLERHLLGIIQENEKEITCKQLNDSAIKEGLDSTEKDVRSLLFFLNLKGYIKQRVSAHHLPTLRLLHTPDKAMAKFEKRRKISRLAVEWLYKLADAAGEGEKNKDRAVTFSVVELLNHINSTTGSLFGGNADVTLEDVEEALLYLSKIGALKIEGGFMVIYNAMNIVREKENSPRYKKEDYRRLDEFYKLRIQQIHIVGEYANLMVKDYDAALRFVHDYFHMDYRQFIARYFKDSRKEEINRNITPARYNKLIAELSERQKEIINDDKSRYIVVGAGPGSGKTRVLVHKLASLLMLEDVKHEQLLMLTFSRSAATEFKQRLIELVGNAAHFVEITTFHSYCFNLLGRVGSLEESKDIVKKASEMINDGEVEPNRICKTVLVVDEAQDMGENEYALIRALMTRNEEMRIILVGDDDQNIYDFRGSDSSHMFHFKNEDGSKFLEMTENYRSARRPVAFANDFLKKISQRVKSTPIIAMRDEEGVVEVTRHASDLMYQPVLDDMLRHSGQGSVGVLTKTNEEAVIMMGLLRRHGFKCKLIQSTGEQRFYNLVEVRHFLKELNENASSQIIDNECWEKAREKVTSQYERSTSLIYLEKCIGRFASTNKEVKYLNDLKEFIAESSVEDFCDIEKGDVVISTIHKSKGREFDDVYMLVSDNEMKADDEQLRRYYVGMTRARNRLFIHTTGNCFDNLSGATYHTDSADYGMPDEIVLQLSLRDVILNHFKDGKIKREILNLRGGDPLTCSWTELENPATGTTVAKFSKNMRKELAKWRDRGYEITDARVRFVASWKPTNSTTEEKEKKEKKEEYATILGEITLSVKKHDALVNDMFQRNELI